MRLHVLMVALVASLILVGSCGDDDTGGSDTTGADGASTIEATASEFQFDPSSWTVSAGQPFTIQFENAGSVEHEWVVIRLGEELESEADFTEERVLVEVEAPAGESATEEFTVDEAGTYQVICAIPDHFDAGMEGSLVVE